MFNVPKGAILLLVFLVVSLLAIKKFNHKTSLDYESGDDDSSSSTLLMSEETINIYKRQTPLRANVLKTSKNIDYFLIYNVLVPEVYCPNLVRLGDIHDGGKWICNPLAVKKLDKCVVYSLGIDNRPTFDIEFQKLTYNKCGLRAADQWDQNSDTLKQLSENNGKFIKAFISNKTDEATDHYTFKDLLRKFDDDQIDIFKIDIEGAEFQVINEILSIPVCQLLIELHHENASEALKMLQLISQRGYYLFAHENNGLLHHISEYSFIHKSCFETYKVNTVLGRFLS